MHITVNRVTHLEQLNKVIPLFDDYRQFYQQRSDKMGARDFLTYLFEHELSAMFVALAEENSQNPVGFVHLYPVFSSIAMRKQWLLNDIYVLPDYRRLGVASLLIETIYRFAASDGADRVILKTTNDNAIAKRCYNKMNFKSDGFDHYVHFL